MRLLAAIAVASLAALGAAGWALTRIAWWQGD